MTATQTSKPAKPEAKPRWEALNPEVAKWVADHARPAKSACLCGCGATTKSRFVPGHDALLKERLGATVVAGGPAAKSAEAALATFGW